MCVCDVFLMHLFVDLIVRSLVHPTSAGYMGATKLIRLVVGRHSNSGNGLISSPFLYHHWWDYHHREGHVHVDVTHLVLLKGRRCGELVVRRQS